MVRFDSSTSRPGAVDLPEALSIPISPDHQFYGVVTSELTAVGTEAFVEFLATWQVRFDVTGRENRDSGEQGCKHSEYEVALGVSTFSLRQGVASRLQRIGDLV